MKINNKDVVCFKIYVDKEYFFCGLHNTENNHTKIFEMSKNVACDESSLVDMIQEITKCFSYESFIFCGYNNNHYDNAFVNMLFKNLGFYTTAGIDLQYMLDRFNDLHEKILYGELDTWKEYKYGKYFRSFDLMKMNFSKKERVSLNEIKFSLNVKSVLSIKDMTTSTGKQSAISNDLEAIKALLIRSKEMIGLRLELSKEFNIGSLSYDDVTLGMKIFSILYADKAGHAFNEVQKPEIPKKIKIGDLILPCIKFQTSFLQNKLEVLSQKEIDLEHPELEDRFSYFGSDLSFGLGGLHSKESPRIHKPEPYDTIALIDGESMYPNLIIHHNLFPERFGQAIYYAYRTLIYNRIKAKNDGEEERNKLFKKIIVSIVGMLNSPSSSIYDPVSFYKITINSQLILLMLGEMLRLELNCKFINWNTDGLFISINKFSRVIMEEKLVKFKEISKVKFTTKYFEELYQFDGNNYFGVLQGWGTRKTMQKDPNDLIVSKGCFKAPWKNLKATNASIIAKAVMAHFLFDIPVDKVIRDAVGKEINSFLLFSKVPDSMTVYYGSIKVGNINRYYYSMSGYSLLSSNPELKTNNFISDKGRPVSLMNVDRTINDLDVNYYICKANTLVAQMSFVQLKMF